MVFRMLRSRVFLEREPSASASRTSCICRLPGAPSGSSELPQEGIFRSFPALISSTKVDSLPQSVITMPLKFHSLRRTSVSRSSSSAARVPLIKL